MNWAYLHNTYVQKKMKTSLKTRKHYFENFPFTYLLRSLVSYIMKLFEKQLAFKNCLE